MRALGGTKSVGVALWPSKPATEAQTRLSDCLNPQRRETLTIDEVMLILRRSREVGYHGAMAFVAQTMKFVHIWLHPPGCV